MVLELKKIHHNKQNSWVVCPRTSFAVTSVKSMGIFDRSTKKVYPGGSVTIILFYFND